MTYESALSKATTEEGVGEEGPPEGEGVSSSLRPHMYLQQTRSDASTRSHTQLPQLSGKGLSSSAISTIVWKFMLCKIHVLQYNSSWKSKS